MGQRHGECASERIWVWFLPLPLPDFWPRVGDCVGSSYVCVSGSNMLKLVTRQRQSLAQAGLQKEGLIILALPHVSQGLESGWTAQKYSSSTKPLASGFMKGSLRWEYSSQQHSSRPSMLCLPGDRNPSHIMKRWRQKTAKHLECWKNPRAIQIH